MATPHVDRLHGIESWSTSSIEDSFGQFETVSSLLRTIADNNRKIVADLGMKGQTADAVCRYFDRVATDLYDQAEKIDQMSHAIKDVMDGGIEAKNHSIQIQADLAHANQYFASIESASQTMPMGSEIIAQAIAKRDALHAEGEGGVACVEREDVERHRLASLPGSHPPGDEVFQPCSDRAA